MSLEMDTCNFCPFTCFMVGFLSELRIELNVDKLQVNVSMEIKVNSAMPTAAAVEDLRVIELMIDCVAVLFYDDTM